MRVGDERKMGLTEFPVICITLPQAGSFLAVQT
jgi:hypothetical protein